MTFRKLLIILTFVVTAVIIMLLGTSYAWYQFDNAVTTFSGVQTFTQGLDDVAIVFTNTDNINTTVGVPILASEAASKASKTTFSITPSSSKLSGKEVAFQIDLINLSIDSALTGTTDLKYSLLEKVGTGSQTVIKSGNFKGVTGTTISLKAMTAATVGTTYSYEFRLWLEETGSNQNSLMGKKISGKFKVSTVVR